MSTTADIESALRKALPAALYGAAPQLTQLLDAVAAGRFDAPTAQAAVATNPALAQALRALAGQRVASGTQLLSFEGAQTGDVKIGVVAGGDVVTLNLALPPAPQQSLHQLARAAELMQLYVDYLGEIGHADAKKHGAYLARLRARLAAPEPEATQRPPIRVFVVGGHSWSMGIRAFALLFVHSWSASLHTP